jgi:hypothetical protein
MKPNDILCPMCDEGCGKFYPATDVDPGFREGIGEEFSNESGEWHCSQSCLDRHDDLLKDTLQDVPETDPLGLPRAYVAQIDEEFNPNAIYVGNRKV